MKKAVYCVCCLVMFVSLMLTGCEELEEFLDLTPNYITVTVSARAKALLQHTDSNGIIVDTPYRNGLIRLKIEKARGENAVWDVTTDLSGYTAAKSASFDVYKEQNVEVHARPQGDKAISYGYKVFTWAEIWRLAGEEFGKSISVSAHDLVVVVEWPEAWIG